MRIKIVIHQAPQSMFATDALVKVLKSVFPTIQAQTPELSGCKLDAECRTITQERYPDIVATIVGTAETCASLLEEDLETDIAMFVTPRYINTKMEGPSPGAPQTVGRITTFFAAIRNRAGNEWLSCLPVEVEGNVPLHAMTVIDEAGGQAFELRKQHVRITVSDDDAQRASALMHLLATSVIRILTPPPQPAKHTLH